MNPSIEVSFHAMLLHECGVKFIGHTHPTAINQVLCTEHAAAFARQRRFPDEVVLCGPQSLLTPYADPGLPLALIMRRQLSVNSSTKTAKRPNSSSCKTTA